MDFQNLSFYSILEGRLFFGHKRGLLSLFDLILESKITKMPSGFAIVSQSRLNFALKDTNVPRSPVDLDHGAPLAI